MNRNITLAMILLSVCLFGCPRNTVTIERGQIDDQPMFRVIDRLNANTAGLDFLLRVGGVSVDGKVSDNKGGFDSVDLSGTLIYRRPRDLYLKLRHLLGSMKVGSNDDEFWIWQQFDPETYFWGRHDGIYDEYDTDFPLRPDRLIEVLGVSRLPDDTTGPNGPAFRVEPEYYELSFFKQDSRGQLIIDKTILIDRYPPYMISSITYFTSDGKPSVRATLSDYEPITATDILTPRKIHLLRLERGDDITMTFGKMERFEKEGEAIESLFYPSPREAGADDLGKIIRIDIDAGRWQAVPMAPTPDAEK